MSTPDINGNSLPLLADICRFLSGYLEKICVTTNRMRYKPCLIVCNPYHCYMHVARRFVCMCTHPVYIFYMHTLLDSLLWWRYPDILDPDILGGTLFVLGQKGSLSTLQWKRYCMHLQFWRRSCLSIRKAYSKSCAAFLRCFTSFLQNMSHTFVIPINCHQEYIEK